MKHLAIVGASGHGKVVADTAELCGWSKVSFFDDAWPDLSINGCWQVSGNTNSLIERMDEFEGVIVAIGNNRIRSEKLIQLAKIGARITTLIHPDATVSRYAVLGEGSVVFAGAVINADVCVGIGAILNTACSVDHDCSLGGAVHISPGANLAGGVEVGGHSWIGIGASVKQSVRIGQNVQVGAGAVVINDVPSNSTVIGVPASPIER